MTPRIAVLALFALAHVGCWHRAAAPESGKAETPPTQPPSAPRAASADSAETPSREGEVAPEPVGAEESTPETGGPSCSGRAPACIIQPVVRAAFGALHECYRQGQARAPNLRGKVLVRFVIGTTGSVVHAELADGSTLPDPEVCACVVAVWTSLRFPEPEGGSVELVFPIEFGPETR